MSRNWKLLLCNIIFVAYIITINLMGQPMPIQIVHGRRTMKRIVVTTSEHDEVTLLTSYKGDNTWLNLE